TPERSEHGRLRTERPLCSASMEMSDKDRPGKITRVSASVSFSKLSRYLFAALKICCVTSSFGSKTNSWEPLSARTIATKSRKAGKSKKAPLRYTHPPPTWVCKPRTKQQHNKN